MDIPEFRALVEDLATNHQEIDDATFWDTVGDWSLEVLAERARAKRRNPTQLAQVFRRIQVLNQAAGFYRSTPETDRHRSNPEVHYRLYKGRGDGRPTTICVQDFDYPDYEDGRFLSPMAWDSEDEAKAALVGLNAGNAAAAGWPKLFDE